ncbi:hypothetical protein C8F01DRAFT_1102191 [Mycena amicta]|nr:hypothetical protein C8F01DRAFT_1102191 [Mycena amicta]
MTFSLTRPSSPNNHSQIPQDGHSGDASNPQRPDPDSGMKERSYLEISLDNEYVCLKGTGNDVEPARLTGHVVLHLAESTPIKEITLQFRGKARLPPAPNDSSMHLSSSVSTYIICTHDWSFLEGERKHSHTLKAGRHFFPFQLQIGGSLPSSVTTGVSGGASVAYKLRAQAVRPGLVNSNLRADGVVQILRSFSGEALEYQQTLEIENTWPEKLMYSIMIPHKAWASTDTLDCPRQAVVSVGTSIHEMTKIHSRNTHEIVAGKAVEISERARIGTPSTTTSPDAGYFSFNPQNAEAGPSSHAAEAEPEPETVEQGQDDVVTFISLAVPATITPTHSLQPITISHRLRWSILIINPDGHTSELRCSLPLHLLDRRLLKEARSHTAATRRLLLGGPEGPPDEDEEVELPSYKAHVRDRVANMYLPEAATVRVANPFLSPSPSHTPPASGLQTPSFISGYASPRDPHVAQSHLPHAPGSGDSTPLDWINSELLLSMQAAGGPNSDSDPSRDSRPRASSPERSHPDSLSIPVAGPNEMYVHSSNASRNLHGLFNVSMKPFTAHPHWPGIGSRTSSHTSLSSLTSVSDPQRNRTRPTGQNSVALSDSNAMLQRAYTEIPDYESARHGFIGGVPPLSSLQGLPSYEEAERGTQSQLSYWL